MKKLLSFLAVLGVLLMGCSEPNQPKYPEVEYQVNGVDFKMILVEGGTFDMGATDEMENPWNDELPVHTVTVSDFYLCDVEVTQALWEALMDTNYSDFPGADLPVHEVSWNECQEFLRRLNELTGEKFRLPTEAEWEFAARGGIYSNHTQFAGSDDIDKVAWYEGNSHETPHPVAQKLPNELGLYDMSGNVWEWCSDYFDNYLEEEQKNPQGPDKGTYRVFRGGSWFGAERSTRISTRDRFLPDESNYNLGFRLALTDPASAIHRR